MINKHIIIGRLGQDPEVRYTNSNNAIANLNIATDSKYKEGNEWKTKTEWHRVILFGRNAENAQQYLGKGSLVYVEGEVQTRQWEDNEGNKRYITETKAYKIQFLDSKRTEKSGSTQAVEHNFNADDDLPF